MNKIAIIILAAGFGLAMMASCGGGGGTEQATEQQDTTKKDSATVAAVDYSHLPAEIQAMIPKGEELYKLKCVACHQATGQGIEGVYPPLANADYLLNDKVRAVAQALNGSHAEITVNGKKYNAEMPQQLDTKEDAVAVVNYILNNFGNKGQYVTLDEVKNIKTDPRINTPAK